MVRSLVTSGIWPICLCCPLDGILCPQSHSSDGAIQWVVFCLLTINAAGLRQPQGVSVVSNGGKARMALDWCSPSVFESGGYFPMCGSENRPLHLNPSVSRSRNRGSHETTFPGVGRESSTRHYFRRSLSLAQRLLRGQGTVCFDSSSPVPPPR